MVKYKSISNKNKHLTFKKEVITKFARYDMGERWIVQSEFSLKKFIEHTEKLYADNGFISFTWSRKKMRSAAQQGAMELYFKMAAQELNNAGIYQEINSQFFKKPLSIPWTEHSFKEFWRSVQLAMFNIKSTTELPSDKVSQIYDVINLALIDRVGIHIPFPQKENKWALKEKRVTRISAQ